MPGKYYDSEKGLHYNWHRYYDPTIGRYLRPDPSYSFQPKGGPIPFLLPFVLGNPQELNVFSYVGNNPIIWVDPHGLRYGGRHGWRHFSNDIGQPPAPPNKCYNKCETSYDDCFYNCQLFFTLPIPPGLYDFIVAKVCLFICSGDKCAFDFVDGPFIRI